MKYVIFKDKNGTIMPVIIPDHVTHSQIQIKEAKAVSAGFFKFEKAEIVTYGESLSLNLKPCESDSHYLLHVILNSGTYAFLGTKDWFILP